MYLKSCHIYYVLFYLDYTNRCAFFLGEIDKPAQGILQRGKLKAVNVGICLEGVYVTDVKEKVSAVLSLVDSSVKQQHNAMDAHLDSQCVHCINIECSFHFSYPDFLAACAAWPAFQ